MKKHAYQVKIMDAYRKTVRRHVTVNQMVGAGAVEQGRKVTALKRMLLTTSLGFNKASKQIPIDIHVIIATINNGKRLSSQVGDGSPLVLICDLDTAED